MSRIKTLFKADNFFHVYQKAEHGKLLFPSDDSQQIFLNALQKVITPYADILGYCLLPDHYHLLIRIKKEKYKKTGFPNMSQMLALNLKRFIRNYNFWINREYGIKGKLLRSFPKTTLVKDKVKAKEILTGIHLNPLYHKISKNPIDYYWSSYQNIINKTSKNLKAEEAIECYGEKKDFIEYHSMPIHWNKSLEP